MSYYHLPHPWNPGYAIPKYVMAEPPGRGTFTTAMLPRGTISQLIPDFLAEPLPGQVRGGPSAVDGFLGFFNKMPGGATSERSQGQQVGFLIGAGAVGGLWLLSRVMRSPRTNPARRRRRRR